MPKAQPLQPELPLWGTDERFPVPPGEARRVVIGDRVVPYALRRSRRRTIGLTIDGAGLRVAAPLSASQKTIESLIQQHGAWVIAKLREWVGGERRPQIRLADGARIPLLGAVTTLRIEAGGNRFIWGETTLTLLLRAGSSPPQWLERALRERALSVFGDRLRHFAAAMRLDVPPLALSNARMRWGSCNRLRGIRLNWRLVQMPLRLVDYVVVHELAHLRQMNHSPRFWSEVAAILPDYRERRRELRLHAERLPEFV